MSKHPTLPDLLAALASDCRNTDGWEDAAKTLDLTIIALDATTAELTRLRSENAELVVALRMAPSPADYKTLDEYTKAFCHWVEWKRSPALVRAGGSRG